MDHKLNHVDAFSTDCVYESKSIKLNECLSSYMYFYMYFIIIFLSTACEYKVVYIVFFCCGVKQIILSSAVLECVDVFQQICTVFEIRLLNSFAYSLWKIINKRDWPCCNHQLSLLWWRAGNILFNHFFKRRTAILIRIMTILMRIHE